MKSLWRGQFKIPIHDFCSFKESPSKLLELLNGEIIYLGIHSLKHLKVFFVLLDLCLSGLVVARNVPPNMQGLPQLVKMIMAPEVTHYGDYWKVEQKFNANNLAYTGATLGLHTDLPYYKKTPCVITTKLPSKSINSFVSFNLLQVQLLHCIEQFKGKGGDNEFVDGFAVAKFIMENHPQEWKLLTTVDGCFSDIGYDDVSNSRFYKVRHVPTIS